MMAETHGLVRLVKLEFSSEGLCLDLERLKGITLQSAKDIIC